MMRLIVASGTGSGLNSLTLLRCSMASTRSFVTLNHLPSVVWSRSVAQARSRRTMLTIVRLPVFVQAGSPRMELQAPVRCEKTLAGHHKSRRLVRSPTWPACLRSRPATLSEMNSFISLVTPGSRLTPNSAAPAPHALVCLRQHHPWSGCTVKATAEARPDRRRGPSPGGTGLLVAKLGHLVFHP